MRTIITLSCLCIVALLIYFTAYKTATLTPTGPGTYNLSIIGITVPYTDTVRSSVAFVFSPLRSSSPEITAVTGTVVLPFNAAKNELSLRRVDGTLIGLLIPSGLESTVSGLKEGDQVEVTYEMAPDKENLFLQRFLIKTLVTPTTKK